MNAPTIRVDTRYGIGRTAITSVASISSEMRIAPSSAVNPAPTCAASVMPAMSGVISRVFANADTKPVNASAPISCEALEPLEADLRAGEERHEEDDAGRAGSRDERAGADRDVGDVAEDLAAVA